MAEPQKDLLEQLADAEDISDVLLIEQKFAVLDQHIR